MSLFYVDTEGDKSLIEKNTYQAQAGIRFTRELNVKESLKTFGDLLDTNDPDDEQSDDDGDYFGLPPPNVDLSKIIDDTLAKTTKQTAVDQELLHASELVDAAAENSQIKSRNKQKRIKAIDYSDFTSTGKHADEALVQINVKEEMTRSVMKPGFEQLKELPKLSTKKRLELGRLERSKTKGAGWFNLPAPEITEEVQNDLKILQMRSVLDPKHFYKKNDLKVLPKYFQIGTVQHSPLDYYSERHIRKNKKHSLVEEIMNDEAVQKYTKRKYQEIVARRDKYAQRKALKKMKKLKKKK